ncbi:MAG: cupin domain-containing protein [Haloarculaceae archaeon]
MQKARIGEVDSWMGPASVKRSLTRALGAEDVSMNYYELEPGESFAFGYHRHEGQEEVFYVLEGEATFETGEPRSPREDGGTANEEGDVAVGAGEAVRFGPGEWQQGWNRGEERVRALALGAPQESGETTILRDCPDCGERTEQDVQRAEDADALVTVCVDCGAETGRFR